jgi:hypothetical protein
MGRIFVGLNAIDTSKNPSLAGNNHAQSGGGSSSQMKTSTDLHFKTYLLIGLMVIFGPLGNVFLGKGINPGNNRLCFPRDQLRHDLARYRVTTNILCGVHAGAVLGRLQLRSTGIGCCIRDGRLAGTLRSARSSHAPTLDRGHPYLLRGARGGEHPSAHNGG